jgi:DNA (cytosine-5)-methyltransferase 1
VNAADYGFPQRRRRVFIVAYKTKEKLTSETLLKTGVLASSLPVTEGKTRNVGEISPDLLEVSSLFGKNLKLSPFLNSGFFQKGKFESMDVISSYSGPAKTLGNVLLPLNQVPDSFHISSSSLKKWKYFKGAKSEERVHSSGYKWNYTEGSMVFPDPIDRPSRTLLTGEGGSSPSRFKHVVTQDGVNRRLHPIEMERLNGFPDDWTRFSGAEEVSDVKRAFFMGNALVVGLIELVGKELAKRMP